MSHKRTLTLSLRVRAPNNLSDRRVAELVSKLLDVGCADARDSFGQDDENIDACEAASLNVYRPRVLKVPT
jgi:hypothetical protein